MLTRRSIRFFCATLAIFMISGLSASAGTKVRVDYDRNADFESYKTFKWKKTPETSLRNASSLMHSRIMNAIEHQMTSSGALIEAEDGEEADLEVTYHTNTRDELRIDTTGYGYGWGGGGGVYYSPYWVGYWGPSYVESTTSYSYTMGTLVVDIIDNKEDKLIWRGTAEGTVPEKPEKAEKKIYSALKKMSKEFQKMRKKDKKGKS